MGFTNCITVVTRADLSFARATTARSSVAAVQMPTGSADYFNNSYPRRLPAAMAASCSSRWCATTVTPASPAAAGVSTANLAIDPTGNTPDLTGAGVLALVAPFTFPAGTSCQHLRAAGALHPVSVSALATGPSIHAWIQFPPATRLLRCGTDYDRERLQPVLRRRLPDLRHPLLNWAIRVSSTRASVDRPSADETLGVAPP
ncbi:MAG: hypothetical protein U1E76_03710 [Planctomycetota bacterium]